MQIFFSISSLYNKCLLYWTLFKLTYTQAQMSKFKIFKWSQKVRIGEKTFDAHIWRSMNKRNLWKKYRLMTENIFLIRHFNLRYLVCILNDKCESWKIIRFQQDLNCYTKMRIWFVKNEIETKPMMKKSRRMSY